MKEAQDEPIRACSKDACKKDQRRLWWKGEVWLKKRRDT